MARRARLSRKRPPKPPTGVILKSSPAVLQSTDPVLQVSVPVPEAERTARASLGRTIPEPVVGLVLIDTGASSTCVSQDVAGKLNLKPLRIAHGLGAGGVHQNPVYFVRFEVAFGDSKTGLGQTFAWEQEAQGIPNLEDASKQLGVVVDGRRMDYVALMGRDILLHADFRYHGPTGTVEMHFDMKSLEAHQSQQ